VVSEEAKFREVKLDRATADLLEALARARGLTLAQLLAEYAAADSSMPGRADIKTGTLLALGVANR
jgi:predicted DNA-binding ribbon-helix-helix protein